MRFTTYTAMSALAALASAQTFTDCNPMEKDCPNDPSMPATFETNFKAGKDAVKGWKQTAGSLTYGPDGAQFTVAKKGDAPTIQSEGFLHFGYVEVKMRAAPGQGIISSIVLQSQDLDEIDWEWIGGQEGKVQMNFFGKGNTTTYDRMIEAPVANTQGEMHTYAVDWKPESITWIIDGKPVRTLMANDPSANSGKNYPQTPCNVRIGNWPGGDSENKGTVEWAGGKVDYTKAPFTQIVESVKVTNYNPGKEYKWTDRSGSKESIQVIEAGNKDGAPQNTIPIQASATVSSQPLASGIDAPNKNSTGNANTPSQNGGDDDSEPCECGTATVTVTGAPPASFTTLYSALNPSSIKVPIVTSIRPTPVPTSGLMIETRPPPGVPAPSAPTGAVPVPTPSRNATVSAPPAQFTGAASSNKAGLMIGAVAGVVLLAF